MLPMSGFVVGALSALPVFGQADAEWAAGAAEEPPEALPGCTAVVIPEAHACPAISVGRQAPPEDACDEIARRNTLDWQPVGGAVVFAVRPAETGRMGQYAVLA